MPATPATRLAEITVNLTAAGAQRGPRKTQLATGTILVVWENTDDSDIVSSNGSDMIVRLFNLLGERVGVEVIANVDLLIVEQREADVAALPGGGFLMANRDSSASTASNRLVERAADGNILRSPTTDAESAADAAPSDFAPCIAATGTSGLIVWQPAEVGSTAEFSAGFKTPPPVPPGQKSVWSILRARTMNPTSPHCRMTVTSWPPPPGLPVAIGRSACATWLPTGPLS